MRSNVKLSTRFLTTQDAHPRAFLQGRGHAGPGVSTDQADVLSVR
jgi:hypothetical protein